MGAGGRYEVTMLHETPSHKAPRLQLDDGFTDFFYFVIFLVAYFWMLSLQLSPNTGYHMSNSLMHVYEEPKFGPNLDKSFQDVASVDDAHSYLEALSLKIYQSSNHEYKCSDCSVTDSRMREKLGEGYLSILSSCAFSDPPSCPFEIDPEVRSRMFRTLFERLRPLLASLDRSA